MEEVAPASEVEPTPAETSAEEEPATPDAEPEAVPESGDAETVMVKVPKRTSRAKASDKS
jgi:hypothetical protein